MCSVNKKGCCTYKQRFTNATLPSRIFNGKVQEQRQTFSVFVLAQGLRAEIARVGNCDILLQLCS